MIFLLIYSKYYDLNVIKAGKTRDLLLSATKHVTENLQHRLKYCAKTYETYCLDTEL